MRNTIDAPVIVREPVTRVEVDLGAIRHNFLQLRRLASSQMVAGAPGHLDLVCVVKAGAYGHGMVEVARTLEKAGCNYFAVSNVDEGIALREAGLRQSILLFETTLPDVAEAVVDHTLTPTVCTLELAQELHSYAKSIQTKVDIHVEVDTGMSRLGVGSADAPDFIDGLRQLDALVLKGIFTHFPSADSDENYTLTQIQEFFAVLEELQRRRIDVPYVHAANSMGLVGYKNMFFNLARPGLMLYGLYPHVGLKSEVDLKPALSVKSKVIFIKTVRKGQGVSYNHTFTAPYDMTVGVLPIGYADGYFRAFSNRAQVLVDGIRCSVLGRVTMDQTMIDLTAVVNPHLGMPAVILGEQNGQTITADDLAGWANTISYEITCNLGNHLPRVYK